VFTGTEGVFFVGQAQEKTKLFRTEKRRDGKRKAWLATNVITKCRIYTSG
jgi:hypothetical protein